MDSLNPSEMVNAGAARAELDVRDPLIRGDLSAMLLGVAATLAVTAAVQTGVPFALSPMAAFAGRARWSAVAGDLAWVFLGNRIGSLLDAGLFVIAATNAGLRLVAVEPAPARARVPGEALAVAGD